MRKHIWILSLLTLALAGTSLAQKESLLIGPGDLLQFDVLDTPEMEQQVRVTDAGTVSLAYIGSVHVAGQTPAAAATAVKELLISKEVMRHPQVTVRVEEYATQDVSVLGQVKTPGIYSVTTGQPVSKVLSEAGGLTDQADRHITIKRHATGEQVNYCMSNDADAALTNMVMVYPGDTVLVARAPVVYILGDVNHPGGYTISTNDSKLTLMQAIGLAGSTNKTSVQSKVRLIRVTSQGRTEERVRLDEIQKGNQPDLTLQANDVVYVPFSWAKNIALSSGAIVASTGSAAVYAVH